MSTKLWRTAVRGCLSLRNLHRSLGSPTGLPWRLGVSSQPCEIGRNVFGTIARPEYHEADPVCSTPGGINVFGTALAHRDDGFGRHAEGVELAADFLPEAALIDGVVVD